jgi:hypothetical protein
MASGLLNNKTGIQPGDHKFYKGIYPVEVTLVGGRKHRVRALVHFLLTSNYSKETKWIEQDDQMTVPARLLWSHQRKSPKSPKGAE